MLARVHTPSSPVRKRERERKREGGRGREREMVIEFIPLLLTKAAFNGMTGALAPFNYLV
jgi:hypothetical protein